MVFTYLTFLQFLRPHYFSGKFYFSFNLANQFCFLYNSITIYFALIMSILFLFFFWKILITFYFSFNFWFCPNYYSLRLIKSVSFAFFLCLKINVLLKYQYNIYYFFPLLYHYLLAFTLFNNSTNYNK